MKTLKKIQLKDAAVLSHHQLKQIRGGSGDGSGTSNPCEGKSEGDICSWTYEERTYSGKCRYLPFNYAMICSDLVM